MPPVDLNRIERLLILKVSSMGDLVHASPVAAALKRAFPHLQIGWIAEDRHAGVLADSPRIDRLHIIPHRVLRERPFGRAAWQTVLRLARELRAERYQVALDLQGLLKSAIWGVLGGVPVRYGAHRMRELTPLLLRRIPIPDRPDRHVVQLYLDAARWLGAPCEFHDLYTTPEDADAPEPPVEFPLSVPDEAHQQVACKLAQLGADGARLISMNPSAGRPWKRWRIENFAELSDRIEAEWGIPVVFVGGPRRQAVGGATSAPQAASPAQPDWAHQPERGDGGRAAVGGACVRRHRHGAHRGSVPRACGRAVRSHQPRPHGSLWAARPRPHQARLLHRLPAQPLHTQRVPAVDHSRRGTNGG
jgi:ADP-heptose:LPS heptosyltransferase